MVKRWGVNPVNGGPEVVLASDYDALAARLAEAERDAARYRWLRGEHDRDRDVFPLAAVAWKGDGRDSSTWVNLVDAEALDSKIDEQLAASTVSATEGER